MGNLSLYEAIFAERMALTDKNPAQDLELALKELESAPTIDLEHEGSIAPPKEEGSMAPPKDPVAPKPKKAPAGMTPATKAMPKLQDDKREKEAMQKKDKKKRAEDAAATSLKLRREVRKQDMSTITMIPPAWSSPSTCPKSTCTSLPHRKCGKHKERGRVRGCFPRGRQRIDASFAMRQGAEHLPVERWSLQQRSGELRVSEQPNSCRPRRECPFCNGMVSAYPQHLSAARTMSPR